MPCHANDTELLPRIMLRDGCSRAIMCAGAEQASLPNCGVLRGGKACPAPTRTLAGFVRHGPCVATNAGTLRRNPSFRSEVWMLLLPVGWWPVVQQQPQHGGRQ